MNRVIGLKNVIDLHLLQYKEYNCNKCKIIDININEE